MAQSTQKNKRYTTSKKALAERIKELEFRNFELERTLESVLSLIQLALGKHKLRDLTNRDIQQDIEKVISRNSVIIDKKDLEGLRNKSYAADKSKPEASDNKEQAKSTADVITKDYDKMTNKDLDNERIALEKEKAELEEKIKKEQERQPLTSEQVEQKEIQRKKRMKGTDDSIVEDIKKQVLKNTMEHVKSEQASWLECSVCGEKSENVGFSEKLQKNYCVSCLQKASLKF